MNFFRSFVFSLVLSLAYACTSGHGTDFRVISPDGTLAVDVRTGDSLTYAVTRHGAPVLLPSAIALRSMTVRHPGASQECPMYTVPRWSGKSRRRSTGGPVHRTLQSAAA